MPGEAGGQDDGRHAGWGRRVSDRGLGVRPTTSEAGGGSSESGPGAGTGQAAKPCDPVKPKGGRKKAVTRPKTQKEMDEEKKRSCSSRTGSRSLEANEANEEKKEKKRSRSSRTGSRSLEANKANKEDEALEDNEQGGELGEQDEELEANEEDAELGEKDEELEESEQGEELDEGEELDGKRLRTQTDRFRPKAPERVKRGPRELSEKAIKRKAKKDNAATERPVTASPMKKAMFCCIDTMLDSFRVSERVCDL